MILITPQSIVGWEMVTADGTIRNVDAAKEPDLAVALRGSGSQFGESLLQLNGTLLQVLTEARHRHRVQGQGLSDWPSLGRHAHLRRREG